MCLHEIRENAAYGDIYSNFFLHVGVTSTLLDRLSSPDICLSKIFGYAITAIFFFFLQNHYVLPRPCLNFANISPRSDQLKSWSQLVIYVNSIQYTPRNFLVRDSTCSEYCLFSCHYRRQPPNLTSLYMFENISLAISHVITSSTIYKN